MPVGSLVSRSRFALEGLPALAAYAHARPPLTLPTSLHRSYCSLPLYRRNPVSLGAAVTSGTPARWTAVPRAMAPHCRHFSVLDKRDEQPAVDPKSPSQTRNLADSISRNDDFPFSNEYPTPPLEEACKMPRKFREVANDIVFQLAIQGKHGATRERLVREVMRVDNVSWPEARIKVEEMNRENDRFAWLAQLPYIIGVSGGVVFGIASLPLVFHKETVVWFAEHIVQCDPEDIPIDEMNSWWSVGSYSWGYMEPLLGTLSFVLLAAQFVRANVVKMGLRPYTDRVLHMRGDRLCRLYPMYDKNIVREFATSDSWHA